MESSDPLATLFARAKKHKVSMAAICKRADIAPTTPSRWKRGRNGATVEKLVALSGALDALIAEERKPTRKSQTVTAQ